MHPPCYTLSTGGHMSAPSMGTSMTLQNGMVILSLLFSILLAEMTIQVVERDLTQDINSHIIFPHMNKLSLQ